VFLPILLTVKQKGTKYIAKWCVKGHSLITLASVKDWIINFRSQWFM